MNVIKNFLNSEKGVFCLGLIGAASALTGLGHMSIEAWQQYTQILAGIYVGGKSLHGFGKALGEGKKSVNAEEEIDELRDHLEENDKKIDDLIKALPVKETDGE